MGRMNRHLVLLAICQGLFLTNNVTFVAVNGLVGLQLAPQGWMATLPVTAYVLGSTLAALPVSRLQARWGRKRSFQAGLLVAMLACALACLAITLRSFSLLLVGTVVAGFYAANAQLYRFAGPELVGPAHKERAISLVLAGGVFGAFVGPNLANASRNWLEVPFAGAYLALIGVAVLALGAVSLIEFPPPPAASGAAGTGRPLRELARQPEFVVAIAAAALGYGVMNLLMAATPIAMQQCGLPFSDAAFVLEWHVIGMFAPGFFTGHLIKRFGALTIMALGTLLYALCIIVALSGVALQQFWLALLLLGVGWNFLFTGSTTLSLQTYTSEEKDRAQGALNFFVFATLALSSLASGILVTTSGWAWLNYGSIVPVSVIGGALTWLAVYGRRPRAVD